MEEKILEIIKSIKDKNKYEIFNFVSNIMFKFLGIIHPIANVQFIKIEKIEPNEYNPNFVASTELDLLYKSIKSDGYTQPSVVFYDKERDKYIIVDGFHRYLIMKTMSDIRKTTDGYLPCVVINKDIKDRIASTIRHNRARGRHAISGMINIVYELLTKGWSDEKIIKELGMEKEELIRLKHISGFAKLFDKTDYSKAWETEKQVFYRLNYDKNKKDKSK